MLHRFNGKFTLNLFQKQKILNKLFKHDNVRISFALYRQVYVIYFAARSWVSGIYSCLSNSHIPYLKANSIFRKSCVFIYITGTIDI